MIVNPAWRIKVEKEYWETGEIDQTLSFLKATQWIIEFLTKINVPFKIYNIGAGVKRITTTTDTCPCCKRKL